MFVLVARVVLIFKILNVYQDAHKNVYLVKILINVLSAKMAILYIQMVIIQFVYHV
jgi:hypothetical protein